MSAGVVVKAILLVVAAQLFIQDAEGLFFKTALTCIRSMVRDRSFMEGLKDKLTEDLSSWQPSGFNSVMYWIFPENGECKEFSEVNFKNVIKEVYGRSLVINLAIKVFIIGCKGALLQEYALILLASDIVDPLFEEFNCTTLRKVVGVVWSTVAAPSIIVGYYNAQWKKKKKMAAALALGIGLGLVPWIICETCLKNIVRLARNDSYYKSELTDIVMKMFDDIDGSTARSIFELYQIVSPILAVIAAVCAVIFCVIRNVKCVCIITVEEEDEDEEETTNYSSPYTV